MIGVHEGKLERTRRALETAGYRILRAEEPGEVPGQPDGVLVATVDDHIWVPAFAASGPSAGGGQAEGRAGGS